MDNIASLKRLEQGGKELAELHEKMLKLANKLAIAKGWNEPTTIDDCHLMAKFIKRFIEK